MQVAASQFEGTYTVEGDSVFLHVGVKGVRGDTLLSFWVCGSNLCQVGSLSPRDAMLNPYATPQEEIERRAAALAATVRVWSRVSR
jgi:hypothetical protein